jgi:Kef-type K+ transport system membrane component KefB
MPEIGAHQLEVAETLIGVGRFLIIFVAARLLAELLVRLQLPTILGELVAGVLIGVSGLHLVVPPETQGAVSQGLLQLLGSLADLPADVVRDLYVESFPSLQEVANIGLFALLFLTGLESELDELVAVGAQATTVAVAGVLLPFALGTMGLMTLFHVDVLDDILGIVILAVVVSLAGGGSLAIGPILKLVAAAVVFVVAAIGLSRSAAPAFDWLIDRLKAPGDVAVTSFVVLTACCFAATAIGLEAALGAFAAGLILSNSRHTHEIEQAVKPIVALFATIFFVLIGTGMDLSVLNPMDPANRPGLVVAAFLLLVAVAGKVASGWSFLSQQPTNRLVVGLGMMPRGEVGLIFLGLGTQAKLLTPALEAAILLMVIGTTFLAPVLLRLVVSGQSNGPDVDPLAEIPT